MMTKDVLLTISGLHYDEFSGREDDNEPIEVITPAAYYLKNNKHYIIYEEVVEGMPGSIKNKIRISGEDQLEILKSGLSGTHMVFEKDKKNMTCYETPFVNLLVVISATNIDVTNGEENMDIEVRYVLDVNYEHMADCTLNMSIKSKNNGDFHLN